MCLEVPGKLQPQYQLYELNEPCRRALYSIFAAWVWVFATISVSFLEGDWSRQTSLLSVLVFQYGLLIFRCDFPGVEFCQYTAWEGRSTRTTSWSLELVELIYCGRHFFRSSRFNWKLIRILKYGVPTKLLHLEVSIAFFVWKHAIFQNSHFRGRQ